MTFLIMISLLAAVIWAHARIARLEQRLWLVENEGKSGTRHDRRQPWRQGWQAPWQPERQATEPARAAPKIQTAPRAMAEPDPAPLADAPPPVAAEPLTPSQPVVPIVPAVVANTEQPSVDDGAERNDADQPEPADRPPSGAWLRQLSVLFEDVVGRRLPIWAGGITLAIAGVLLVNYAHSVGFFARVLTPGIQCLLGTMFGLALIAGAEWAHRQRDRVKDARVSQALAGAGISTLYAAITVATTIYGLIPPLAGFFAFAVLTAGALGLALRHGPASALLGLVGGLAMPAITLTSDDQIPLLTAYLTLLTAGLIGVSRMRQWSWLAFASLAGAAGWGLWLVLTRGTPHPVDSIALGGFIMVFALLLPGFVLRDQSLPQNQQAQGLLRAGAALIGAGQLALLLSLGGYQPLDWALFGLIAAAGQWFAWRDRDFALVPSITALLAGLLLLDWPNPPTGALACAGIAMAAIHAVPLLLRLWRQPVRLQWALELSALGAAVPLVTMVHYAIAWGMAEHVIAASCTLGALLPLIGALLGRDPGRRGNDARLAVLLGSGWALLIISLIALNPLWQAPLWTGGMALALLLLARPAQDLRLERVAAGFATLAIILLLSTGQLDGRQEWAGLFGFAKHTILSESALRWSIMTLLAIGFLWRSDQPHLRMAAQISGMGLAYGTAAQLLNVPALPLVTPAAALALALTPWDRRALPAIATAVAIAAAWALAPVLHWQAINMAALVGDRTPAVPAAMLTVPLDQAIYQLLIPAILLGGVLWRLRDALHSRMVTAASAVLAVVSLIAVHILFRAAYAAAIGDDFTAFGLGQRLVWSALLLGSAALVWRSRQRWNHHAVDVVALVLASLSAAHLTWFSLILYNPLWSAQAVGALPLANLLLPLFAGLPLCLMLAQYPLARLAAARSADDPVARLLPLLTLARQVVMMIMIAMFAWASLRHAFHGSLLTVSGIEQAEDILRSLLGIVLAIAYLQWGIRRKLYAWRIGSLLLMLTAVAKVFLLDAAALDGLLRIGSFMALGFSLIGIGWLYSRQLRQSAD